MFALIHCEDENSIIFKLFDPVIDFSGLYLLIERQVENQREE
jgi:hypothetical protein